MWANTTARMRTSTRANAFEHTSHEAGEAVSHDWSWLNCLCACPFIRECGGWEQHPRWVGVVFARRENLHGFSWRKIHTKEFHPCFVCRFSPSSPCTPRHPSHTYRQQQPIPWSRLEDPPIGTQNNETIKQQQQRATFTTLFIYYDVKIQTWREKKKKKCGRGSYWAYVQKGVECRNR